MKVLIKILTAVMSLMLASSALPQSYPDRSVRWIIGYPPGGGGDFSARTIGNGLQTRLGQPVVVDNRPGAATIVAADLAAKAPPDGYTFLRQTTGR